MTTELAPPFLPRSAHHSANRRGVASGTRLFGDALQMHPRKGLARMLPTVSPRCAPGACAGGASGPRRTVSRRCEASEAEGRQLMPSEQPGRATRAGTLVPLPALFLVRADAIVRTIRDGLPHHRLRPFVPQDSRQLRRGVHLEQFRRHFRARAAPMTRHHVQIYRDQLAYLAHTASLGCCPDRIRRVEQRLYRKKVTPPARIVNAPAP